MHGPPSTFKALLESAAGSIDLPERPRVAQALEVRCIDAGGTAFLQGVEHPHVYTVASGLLKLCYLGEDGSEWIKSFAHEGRFFASIAALAPGGRTTFMVTALEPCILERID